MVMDNPVNLNLLIEVLALDPEQGLLIIFDAFGFDVAHRLAEAVTTFGIPFCARFIPLATQLQYVKAGTIPDSLDGCIRRCDALVFVVSDHEPCTRFRVAALTAAKESQTKILHLPGVDLALLEHELQGLDLSVLRKKAIPLKHILDGAVKVEILTQEHKRRGKGIYHKLSFSLLGRKVHCDVGSVASGEIAQFPPGEVYIAPIEYSAEGTLVINGAAPERVFWEEDYIVLHFANGKLDVEKSYFSESVAGQGFRQELLEFDAQDPRNLLLGEFGVGLNESTSYFTGKPIRDEKAYGTAHIALGSNTPFDGEIDCDCHIDLIFIPTRIMIDGVELPCKWGLGKSCRFE